MTLEAEYREALSEIGEILPYWSEEDGFYIFQHPAYPTVDYVGDTPQATVKGYKRILKSFIRDRMMGNVAEFVDKMTSGRGGVRPNSGRPRNKIPAIRIYVPKDIADWLQDPGHVDQIRALMQG